MVSIKKRIQSLSLFVILLLLLLSILILSGCSNRTSEQEVSAASAAPAPAAQVTVTEEAGSSNQNTAFGRNDMTGTVLSGANNEQTGVENERTGVENEQTGAENEQSGGDNDLLGADDAVPTVYYTSEISPEGLSAVYDALERKAEGENIAVKLHTGEGTASNNLRPELIKDFVQGLDATIVECNTAVGGRRASTAMHYQVAKDRGYTAIAPVVILDENGSMELPVQNGRHLTGDLVGQHFGDYDFYVVLSHFKGHLNGGFGGAIKNMSIGFASSAGKNRIHTAGGRDTSWFGYENATQDDFLESMAEAAKAVSDYCGDNILYINVMNRLSVDCDCDPTPREPTMADIGILASLDPVALDQACVDLVYAAPDSQDLIERIESLHGQHTLDYGEEIGLGSREYTLVKLM